jgi:hypothetical protein
MISRDRKEEGNVGTHIVADLRGFGLEIPMIPGEMRLRLCSNDGQIYLLLCPSLCIHCKSSVYGGYRK